MIAPEVVTRPTTLVSGVVYQRFPSGPLVMNRGVLELPIGNSA